MAIALINIGNIANDNTGDDLREAFLKVNQNFEDIDLRNDEKTTVVNLGSVGEGIFANNVNYELQLKKIAAGDNISLLADEEKIVISVNNIGVTDITISGDTGSLLLDNSAKLTISGSDAISTSVVNGALVITNEYVAEIVDDLTPQLGGTLDAQGFDIINAGTITGTFVGGLTGLINGTDPAHTAYHFNNTDFGSFYPTLSNMIDLLVMATQIDMGTFNNPTSIAVEQGSI